MDARSWWGVPNTLDVLSNLPLVLAGVICMHAVVKLLELGDEAAFDATGEWVSGYSLKHVGAPCAALPTLGGMRRQALGGNAPVHFAAMG